MHLHEKMWQVHHKKRKAADYDAAYALRKVPETFTDLDEYLQVFESLLLEECRAQILRGEEEQGRHSCPLSLYWP